MLAPYHQLPYPVRPPRIIVRSNPIASFAPPFLASSAGAAASGKAGRGGGASSPAGSTVFLSINRYERKKGIGLAIKAFADMLAASSSSASASAASGAAPPPHLVIAGGYDTRMAENVEHYDELVAVARAAGLITPERPLVAGAPPAALLPGFPAAGGEAKGAYAPVEGNAHVTFLRSFSDAQKAYLLRAASAVLYTPENEHFGIVPLEAMAAFRPVVAVASGGPLESVEDGVTGFLCEPTTTVSSVETEGGERESFRRQLGFFCACCYFGNRQTHSPPIALLCRPRRAGVFFGDGAHCGRPGSRRAHGAGGQRPRLCALLAPGICDRDE